MAFCDVIDICVSRYRVPHTGYYLIHSQIRGAATAVSHHIKVAGQSVVYSNNVGNHESGSSSAVLHLLAGQEVKIVVVGNDPVIWGTSGYMATWFSATLLHPE